MAVVLPMAGVQQYACTLDMKFSGNLDECPMTGDCCDEHDSGIPDCMVEIDLLPDAELPNLGLMPFLKADEVIYLRLSASELEGIDVLVVDFELTQEPPDSLDWYVKQQRLLI